MLPVATDAEAFARVRQRLQNDVGRLIQASTSIMQQHLTVPFWGIARMLFPVAEALGDLIFQRATTADNLLHSLEALEDIRPGYRDKAAIIALLYRHPLVHTDELRILRSGGKSVAWSLSFKGPEDHLRVEKIRVDTISITFDLTAFYEDLVTLCDASGRRDFGGTAAARYNAWTVHHLDTTSRLTSTERRAKIEIDEFFKPGP